VTAAIVQVEPLTRARAPRGPFDYRLGADLGGVDVGSLLMVPFGRQQLMGVVVGLREHSELPSSRLLSPLRALALDVPPELVSLASFIAHQYCSTPARALALMLPPGGLERARPRTQLVAEITASGAIAAEAGTHAGRRLTALQLELLRTLAEGPRAASALAGGHAALRRLAGHGLVALERREIPRRPRHIAVGARSREPLPLTAEQERAFARMARALERRQADQLLLHGVTGSGKTELYLRAASSALEQGRGAIVLVPEIALTPQMVGRFVERLGDTVAVLHSRLSLGQRYDEWRRLRAGEARVCVGPRSAIFAPVERLGLIVVDEEHDSSYKHEGDPRYDARAVAAERARLAGALLVLGSATPRAESYRAAETLRLSRRVDRRPLPPVRVLDMRGLPPGLHPEAVHALARLRHARGKGIVLLNRRGWSSFLSCRACGRLWGCPQCDVALVLHRREAALSCHHCGHREPVPVRCECGSASIARHGMGTERLHHDLDGIVGGEDFPLFRLDADLAAAGAGEVLRRFERAPAGLLLGTQMVAKGHDFPDVTLGIVLDADSSLSFPDFRAEERTFALLAQLAGRVGRGADGNVLVQTLAPEARAIRQAALHDSSAFLEGELERRQMLAYPPFSQLIRIVCAAPEAKRATVAAGTLGARLRERIGPGGASVLGPAALFRLRGRERRALLLKASDREGTVRAVDEAVHAVATAREHSGVNFSVDVEPQ
jgi:primosomal protein N' (replication factor Y)